MTPHAPDRRVFLTALLGGAASAVAVPWADVAAALTRTRDAHAAAGGAVATFTAAEAATLEAFAAQVIPTDETPGAREAGVIRFMDAWFGAGDRESLPLVRQGIAALDAAARARGAATFPALPAAGQVAVMQAVEQADPAFFRTARAATVLGMFAHPKHGGNADKVGWQLVGFEDRFGWSAPFGSYDRG